MATSLEQVHLPETPLEQLEAFLNMTGGGQLLNEMTAAHRPTGLHCKATGQMALLTSLAIGLDPTTAFKISHDASIHDIGKDDPGILPLVSSSKILNVDERAIVSMHPGLGALIAEEKLHTIEGIYSADDIYRTLFTIANHHTPMPPEAIMQFGSERESRELDINSTRLVEAVDIYHALTDIHRLYRRPLSPTEATEATIAELRDKLEVVAIFGKPIEEVVPIICEQRQLLQEITPQQTPTLVSSDRTINRL